MRTKILEAMLGVNFLRDFGSEGRPCTTVIDARRVRARERLPGEASAIFEKGGNTVKPNHVMVISYDDDDEKCFTVDVHASTHTFQRVMAAEKLIRRTLQCDQTNCP